MKMKMLLQSMKSCRFDHSYKGISVGLIATVSACVGFMIHDLMTKQGMFMFYAEFFPTEPFLYEEFKLPSEAIPAIGMNEIQYDGCPDFEKNRVTGCYPRLLPPTLKPCRMCSSQIHLVPGTFELFLR